MSKFLLLIPLLLFVALPFVSGSFGSGTVIIHVPQGSVQGQLQEATLQGDKVTMSMIIDDQIVDSAVKATAKWIGTRADQAVSGTVRNFTGTVAGRAFTGQADWSGTLSSSLNGNGTLTGSISLGLGLPIDGTWKATFMTIVPEFPYANILLVLATITSFAIIKHHLRKRIDYVR